jgi:hypothetical protein
MESLTFVSDFVALWTAVDMIGGLWYKLWMIGIPLDGVVKMVFHEVVS